jgi:pimeloyl-ACP methyl ester carboxylesterase
MKRFFFRLIFLAVILYIGACSYMYFFQESFIFHPSRIDPTVKIELTERTEELAIKTKDGIELSGLICKPFAESRNKKLVFFLHGNTGNLLDQKEAASLYTSFGYDFFCMGYRSYGKSGGKLIDETTFFDDVRTAFKMMSNRYGKENMVVIGYSLGTASAAMIASEQNPSALVLIAPYYSLVDMTARNYPWIPTQLVKYRFETDKYVRKISHTPILLVHGDKDQMIPFQCSSDLSKLLNNNSEFLTLKGQTHDYFERNEEFVRKVKKFLSSNQESIL